MEIDLPIEPSLAAAKKAAKANNGSYDCVINGRIYGFFKNTRGRQDFRIYDEPEYRHLLSLAHSIAETGCRVHLSGK